MPAYLIADIEIKQVPAAIAAHGGRYLARGGATEVLEGTWTPKRAVIVEFPSMALLKAFYDAPEYRALLELRQRTTKTNLLAVEGV